MSPIVNKNVNQHLNNNPNDIESVHKAARNMNRNSRDNELAKVVMRHFMKNLISQLESLPEFLNKDNQYKGTNEIDKQRLGKFAVEIGSALYATRNSIAHAKANYEKKKNECPKEQLEQLNVFMKETCRIIIESNEYV